MRNSIIAIIIILKDVDLYLHVYHLTSKYKWIIQEKLLQIKYFSLHQYIKLSLPHVYLQEKDRMRHNEWHQAGHLLLILHIYLRLNSP